MRSLRCLPLLMGAFLVSNGASVARAELFFIDPAQSSLTMTMNIGTDFMPQAAGVSDVTSYFGTIDATLAGPSITFNAAGTTISANNSGSWKPDTTGDVNISTQANYGFQGTVIIYPTLLATRDMTFTLSGGAINPTFDFTAGTSDATATTSSGPPPTYLSTKGQFTDPDPDDAAKISSPNFGTAIYTPKGDGSGTLTIPIDVTFTQRVGTGFPDAIFSFNGTLVAVSAVPEPSGGLLSCIALGLIACRRRHRKLA